MDTVKNLLVMLSIPLLLTVGLLLIAGGGDGKYRHEGIERVEHPREDVFDWLSDPERRLEWVEGLRSSACDRRDVEAGARLSEVVDGEDGRRKRVIEVLEAQPGAVFAYRASEPGRTIEMRYKLSILQSSRRTRVDYTLTCTFDAWWARILEPWLGMRLVDEVEADVARLDAAMRRT